MLPPYCLVLTNNNSEKHVIAAEQYGNYRFKAGSEEATQGDIVPGDL